MNHTSKEPEVQSPAPNEAAERAAEKYSIDHDQRSFEVLARAVEPALEKVIRGKHVRENDYGDVVNRTLMVLWRRREDFSGTYADFFRFASGIARRESLKCRRGEARYLRTKIVPREMCSLSVGADDVDEQVSPEDLTAIDEALERLPRRERFVMRARAEGATWQDVAAMAGLSIERVRQIHAKALEHMKETGQPEEK